VLLLGTLVLSFSSLKSPLRQMCRLEAAESLGSHIHDHAKLFFASKQSLPARS
jgi:hypothetical protein